MQIFTNKYEVIWLALIDVVKFNGLASRDWIIYKHYAEDLSTASQLIVGEGQVAAFIKGGQLCDLFGPGTYTLSTNNIPILSKLINLPFGGKTPFSAEVYYVNAATKLDINWGTSDPIQLIDPKYQIRLRIRAFGQIGLKISDFAVFIKELIGSMGPSEVVNYDSVIDYFKGIIVTKVKSCIAQIIIEERISALEISAKLNDISEKLNELMAPDFAQFGLKLVNFYIKSVNFPDEDFEKINNILADKAAFDIMGDSRYSTKRSFDVYEGAANNQNGVAGAFAAGGLGLGIGAGVGMNGAAMQGVMSSPKPADVYCPQCHAPNSANSKFCNSCGSPLVQQAPPMKKCPECSADIPEGSKFCNSCGAKIPTEIVCECGAVLSPGSKFCNNCGKKVGE